MSLHRLFDVLPCEMKEIIPHTNDSLVKEIDDFDKLGGPFRYMLLRLVDSFYSDQSENEIEPQNCLVDAKVLLDIIWEKINTGHWKDVDVSWRQCYSVVSLVKALVQCVELIRKLEKEELTFDRFKSVCVSEIVKTCDMGLLFGSPILNNIFAKLAKLIQILYFKDAVQDRCTLQAKESVEKIPKTNMLKVHSERNSACLQVVHSNNVTSCESSRPNVCREKCSHYCEEDNRYSKKRKVSLKEGSVGLPKTKHCLSIPVEHCPSLQVFMENFFNAKQPVIIDGAMDHWPALSSRLWSLDYIKKVAGLRTVPIEIGSKYTEDTWTQKLLTVKEFIEKFIENQEDGKPIGYLAQHQLFDQIPELRDDISIPTYCSITDGSGDEDIDINAWFGPKGTISPLHFDPKHNLLAQVVGEKLIYLYEESESGKLYPHTGRLLNNTSQVDVENPDLVNFPNFKDAKFQECVLKPGQLLYIPPKCWHYVRSLDVSFSVSFWWK